MQRLNTRRPLAPSRWIRLFGVALALVFTLSLLPAARADSAVRTEAQVTPSERPLPAEDAFPLDQFSLGQSTGWMSARNLSDPTLRVNGGFCYLTALPSVSDADEYTLLRLYGAEDSLSLLAYETVSVILDIGGAGAFTVRISLFSGVSAFQAEGTVTAGGWHAVSVDLSEWTLRTAIDALEITVIPETGAQLSSLSVGSLSAAGSPSLDIADAFLTFGFTADGGTADFVDGSYILDTEGDGALTLLADAARDSYDPKDGTMALEIVLDNAIRGGTVSLATSDAFVGISSFTIASSVQTQYGRNTYFLPFDAARPFRAFRLNFRNLFPDGDGDVRLLSVRLVYLPKAPAETAFGKISLCALSQDLSTLNVTGTLPSQTVARYINATLALYEIPVWSDLSTVLMTEEPLSTIKISTRFSFTESLALREASAVSRYAVVLVTEDGPLTVSEPRFPDLPAGESRPSRSVVGLSGADPAGVFTANAANVLVDVYVDRLLGGTEGVTGGRLTVRGGRYFYLDYSYLKELDAILAFYEAADVDVYLRLLSATDLSSRGFTFGGEEADFYAFDVTREEGAYMLSAVTDYIASRYRDLRGFILGARLDVLSQNYTTLADPKAYAALCTDTMGIVYEAAAPYIPDVSVILPFGHYGSDVSVLTDSETGIDPSSAWLATLISRNTENSGGLPFGLLFLSDSANQMVGSTENLLACMKAVRVSPPETVFLLWQPTERYTTDILLSEYTDRALAARSVNARVLFLQLDPQSDTEELYEQLKYVHADRDEGRYVQEFDARLSDSTPNVFTGLYPLYDFTRSFSTLDWIAGSGCVSLTTQQDRLADGQRSMQAQFAEAKDKSQKNVSGSILCTLPETLDFTPAPTVVYTLRLTAEGNALSEAELIFLFGSEDNRAEYKVRVPVGETVHVHCDLSAYEDRARINSAAILVQAESMVTLDVSKILCYSQSADGEALLTHFEKSGDAAEGSSFLASLTPKKTAALLFAVGASLSVFALLSRRGKRREETHRSH